MASNRSLRTEMIVAAAALLFARQGYRGTTTIEIARMAGVSENTLFRHFDHKEDIFWSALRSHASALTLRDDLLGKIRGGDTPEVVLPKVLEFLTDTVHFRPEVMRLIGVAVVELPERAEPLCRDLISPLFSEIRRYMASSIEKGEVMKVDPTLLAASLMAMAFMYPQLAKLTQANDSFPPDIREATRACTKFWLDVLSPRLRGSSISNQQTAEQASTDHNPESSSALDL